MRFKGRRSWLVVVAVDGAADVAVEARAVGRERDQVGHELKCVGWRKILRWRLARSMLSRLTGPTIQEREKQQRDEGSPNEIRPPLPLPGKGWNHCRGKRRRP